MMEMFKAVGPKALSYSHYDLADKTEAFDPESWKAFLMLPAVSEWIRTELDMLQSSELRKLIQGVSSSRSVGQAQLINSLTKMQESNGLKEGPIFIYSYVPLDNEQMHAPTVRSESNDIFLI
jgi:endo-1,4-beta-D-glucanase Y